MNKVVIFKILFSSVVIICFWTIGFFEIKRIKEKKKEVYLRFQSISETDSLNNFVKQKHIFTDFKGTRTTVFITLDNDKEFRISAGLNPDFNYAGINDVLYVGDLLLKRIGSDTVFIKKKSFLNNGYNYSNYYFIFDGP